MLLLSSQVEGIIWALKFPSLSSYRDFAEHLDDYAFENEFGVPNDDVVSVSYTGEAINHSTFALFRLNLRQCRV